MDEGDVGAKLNTKASEGLGALHALCGAVESSLHLQASTPATGTGKSNVDKLQEARDTYKASRDRLIRALKECDALQTTIDNNEDCQNELLTSKDDAWEMDEKANTRKQELEDELKRKNADLKRIMDLLRSMLNDIGMWDSCGKSALQKSN